MVKARTSRGARTTSRAHSKNSLRKTATKVARKTAKKGRATTVKKAAKKAAGTSARKAAKPAATKKTRGNPGGVSDAAVTKATGKGWDHWLGVLDAFDVRKNGHKAAAAHLHERHGVSEWWSQMVTVGYEQKRGLRALRQKSDGFSASASRTIAAGISRVLDAFEDKGLADRWLPTGVTVHKVSRPPMKDGRPTKPGSARMTWTDGSKTLSAWIADKSAKSGPAKTAVQVQHDKLPDATTCDRMRALWAERMDTLRDILETAP